MRFYSFSFPGCARLALRKVHIMNRLVIAFIGFILTSFALAATTEDALRESRAGNYAKAYPMWVELADRGDDMAIVEVGLLHHQGQGVPVQSLAN